jgi:Ni/Co efflux regulator RcnB
MIGLHLSFVISGVMMALMDWLSQKSGHEVAAAPHRPQRCRNIAGPRRSHGQAGAFLVNSRPGSLAPPPGNARISNHEEETDHRGDGDRGTVGRRRSRSGPGRRSRTRWRRPSRRRSGPHGPGPSLIRQVVERREHRPPVPYQGQAHAAIRGSSFHYPHGYSYRRWSTGQRLPMLFLTARYFFDDYSDLGFGPPPFGDCWVRYGSDLLLVDIRSGQVVDVIYGAFY